MKGVRLWYNSGAVLRTAVLFIIYVIAVLAIIPFFGLCFLLRLRQPLLWYGKAAMWLGPKVLGVRVEVQGREQIDRKRTYIFMSNHLSFLDGPLLFLVIPKAVRIILKKEIFRIPVVGLGMGYVGFVPVDRKGIKSGRRSIERAASLIREKGYSFLIFPEGTRSRDGCLQPFRRGGFYLTRLAGIPIVPITISGTYELMPRGQAWVRRGKVKVVFHPSLAIGDKKEKGMEELMDRVRTVIRSALPPEEEAG